MNASNRRDFLKTTAIAASTAFAAPMVVPASALGRGGAVAPSERIVLGGLGIGPRGTTDLKCFLANPDVQFVAIADLQKSRREAVKTLVDGTYENKDCVLYQDMFDILARDDIDSLLIATGDRWHTMASILAAKAGKDVYCEKPCSLTIAQSRALADAYRKYNRVYQAGTQRRTIGNFEFDKNLVQDGRLGKLHTIHANTRPPGTSHHWLPAEPEPAKDVCDWDRWLGACPWRPYNSAYVRGRWRGHFDFHGGGILEWGSHTVDLCQWAAGRDDTAPVEYVPNADGVECYYADGLKLVMRSEGWMGMGTCSVRYEGDEGWIETGDSGNFILEPEPLRTQQSVFHRAGTDPTTHIRNFLDCVKTRALTNANASVVAQSHVVCHAAYISWQLGRKLTFDPVKEEFANDEEANRMRSRAMREPWHV
ncbi:MAG: Gfo/Idh/MocA family oxidoreductase [Fuerstiella sp.]|nr:Gfo/Idh/MocA family oxidoreductase [Fuerstiella sp.]